MTDRSSSVLQTSAFSLRSNIKSATAQLDSWASDQAQLLKKRRAANARYSTFDDRLRIAKYQAKLSFPSQPNDPTCARCDSPFHPTDNCDAHDTFDSLQRQDELDTLLAADSDPDTELLLEDPAIAIHRAIVHRLYLNACNLYLLLYPRFYPGPRPRPAPLFAVSPVPLTGPDYLTIAISLAALDYQSLPGIDGTQIREANLHASSFVAHLYYSKAFPVSFVEFCNRVALCVEDSESEAPPSHPLL
jgi:hypothetical protein